MAPRRKAVAAAAAAAATVIDITDSDEENEEEIAPLPQSRGRNSTWKAAATGTGAARGGGQREAAGAGAAATAASTSTSSRRTSSNKEAPQNSPAASSTTLRDLSDEERDASTSHADRRSAPPISPRLDMRQSAPIASTSRSASTSVGVAAKRRAATDGPSAGSPAQSGSKRRRQEGESQPDSDLGEGTSQLKANPKPTVAAKPRARSSVSAGPNPRASASVSVSPVKRASAVPSASPTKTNLAKRPAHDDSSSDDSEAEFFAVKRGAKASTAGKGGTAKAKGPFAKRG